MPLLSVVLLLAIAIFQFAAFFAGIQILLPFHPIGAAMLAFLGVCGPGVALVGSIFGMIYAWGWTWWQAGLMAALPFALPWLLKWHSLPGPHIKLPLSAFLLHLLYGYEETP